ncbi:MAG: hypothetical protein RLY20_689 [Verrucomicrobiota bacterium]|jgi:hypothetical protein
MNLRFASAFLNDFVQFMAVNCRLLPNKSANGGGLSRLQSAHLMASVTELVRCALHAHMRCLLIIAVTTLLISGCVEPYPNWTIADIPYDDLPRAVKTAFRQDFADARVSKVERATFESRISAYPKKFRLTFERPGIDSQRIIYDAFGKREDGFDFWFDRPKPRK